MFFLGASVGVILLFWSGAFASHTTDGMGPVYAWVGWLVGGGVFVFVVLSCFCGDGVFIVMVAEQKVVVVAVCRAFLLPLCIALCVLLFYIPLGLVWLGLVGAWKGEVGAIRNSCGYPVFMCCI